MHAMYNVSLKVMIFNHLLLASDKKNFIYCLKLVITVTCDQIMKEETKKISYQ